MNEVIDNRNLENVYGGLDLSYSGSGVILIKDKEIIHKNLISTPPSMSIEERILLIAEEIKKEFLKYKNLRSVYIEGLAFNAKGDLAELGALHYYLRIVLYLEGIPVEVVAPGSLKKFTTGTGKGKKNLMLLKTYIKWGEEFDDDNLCDAYALARMAYELDTEDKKVKEIKPKKIRKKKSKKG